MGAILTSIFNKQVVYEVAFHALIGHLLTVDTSHEHFPPYIVVFCCSRDIEIHPN